VITVDDDIDGHTQTGRSSHCVDMASRHWDTNWWLRRFRSYRRQLPLAL